MAEIDTTVTSGGNDSKLMPITMADKDIAPSAFSRVYRMHIRTIHRYCLFRTNSYEDAEDIAAETFIRFLRNENNIREELILPWLFAVAGNLCINHNRRRSKLSKLELIPDRQPEYPKEPWGDKRAWEALVAQSPRVQEVIYLRVLEDMSFANIARFLRKSESAVKMLFYRGIKKLRKILEGT